MNGCIVELAGRGTRRDSELNGCIVELAGRGTRRDSGVEWLYCGGRRQGNKKRL